MFGEQTEYPAEESHPLQGSRPAVFFTACKTGRSEQIVADNGHHSNVAGVQAGRQAETAHPLWPPPKKTQQLSHCKSLLSWAIVIAEVIVIHKVG